MVALFCSFPLLPPEPLSLEVSDGSVCGLFFLSVGMPADDLPGSQLELSSGNQIGGARNRDYRSIDNEFFFHFMGVQGVLAFLLTAFVGPGLISPDLANGALPLYFCRPFSRAEYVLGKSSVLAILLSQITWIPGLILFAMQASLAGPAWTWSHLWIAGSLVLSSLIWIAILSLLAMALSAWVKWRIVAGALLLAVMFFGAGFAQAVNAVLQTESGHFFNVAYLMTTVWTSLFGIEG